MSTSSGPTVPASPPSTQAANGSFDLRPLDLSTFGGGLNRFALIAGTSVLAGVAVSALLILGALIASSVSGVSFVPLMGCCLVFGSPLSVISAFVISKVLSVEIPSDHQVLQDALEKTRREKILEILTIDCSEQRLGQKRIDNSVPIVGDSQKIKKDFLEGVCNLKASIEKMNISQETVESIRKKLNQLLGHQYYKDHQTEKEECINFVQLLAIKMHCANGQSVLEQYAEATVSYFDESLSKIMQKRRSNSSHWDREGIMYVPWAMSNPSKAFLALTDRGLNYDAHSSNPSHLGLVFKNHGQKMQGIVGPVPTGDLVWQAALQGYKKLGLREIYLNHQDTSKNTEDRRIKEAGNVNKPEVLEHVVIGFDAKKKNKDIEEWLNTPIGQIGGYIRKLRNKIDRQELGIHIPAKLLSEDEIQQLLTEASIYFQPLMDEAIKNLSSSLSFKQRQKEIKKIKLGVIMGIDAMLEATIIHKQKVKKAPNREHLDPDFQDDFIRSCCKQHVDRGTVQTAAAWIFHRALSQQSLLTLEEKKLIMAEVLGRSVLVDDRQMIHSKESRFVSLLQLIGEDEKSMKGLSSFMKNCVSLNEAPVSTAPTIAVDSVGIA